MATIEGEITRVAGSLIQAKNMTGVQMYEVCRVGSEELIGEVIALEGDVCSIQVYEETAGIRPTEKVIATGGALSVELGPGLISQIYDGIERPLPSLKELSGDFITRGIVASPLDRTKKWSFTPRLSVGDNVTGGDILGTVPETTLVEHRIMVPPRTSGKVVEIVPAGDYTIEDVIAVVETDKGRQDLTMMQKWPVRVPRPIKENIPAIVPLFTGQRIFDTFFPMSKGGTGAIPGGFGTGKTVMQHQLAQWADTQVVVYVGCGERGNEMTEVLERFPELEDPRSGEPLMKRTVLIANTSNMPVAAREASIYTGITLAEYFRDMGYDVSIMADSTSRWAEALREISGRLEEMPGEEGYPAYLASRIAEFYERAGRVKTLGSDERYGSVSVVGAVSPPGGDFSEPVTQNTLRVVKVFWALSKDLASRRHFPAIDWLTSYSLYQETLEEWYKDNLGADWRDLRIEAMSLLQKEKELKEIVQLVGPDALPEIERVVLEAARIIREDYLMQHAYHPVDSYCSLDKAKRMLGIIMQTHQKMRAASESGASIADILKLGVYENISRLKIIDPEKIDATCDELSKEIDEQFATLIG
ncbi:V-type ATP synthase subunit A [Candidatus Borrarchaeum sp.]|uniref:V-type ATP synthase subunit A n=1 Tax=Candidatus Borrarchaeum sp. TaxID=2846742 RepID=UPI00257B8D97|nr:V-type ATP synthase subunit A [Candidatus Borrarchaeum sp.]